MNKIHSPRQQRGAALFVALILLIGNYTGYRLLELYRFHTIMLEDR